MKLKDLLNVLECGHYIIFLEGGAKLFDSNKCVVECPKVYQNFYVACVMPISDTIYILLSYTPEIY